MAQDITADSSGGQFLSEYGPFLFAGFGLVLALVGASLAVIGDQETTQQWLNQYGLGALFFILILEGAMMLYFAPSESLIPITVLFVMDSIPGYIAAILVAVAGATIGQYGLFLLAKRGGREYLLSKAWFRVSESSLDRFDGWFDRWGAVVVPVSNALLFTRGMVTVPAGLAEMRDREFVLLSAVGTLLFQTWLALAALYFVEYLPDSVPI